MAEYCDAPFRDILYTIGEMIQDEAADKETRDTSARVFVSSGFEQSNLLGAKLSIIEEVIIRRQGKTN